MAMEQAVEMMRGGSFERMRQKILECLRDPAIEDFSVLGWEGVGRSMITRQVVDELSKKEDDQEEEEGESSLFDHIIWLPREGSMPILLETTAKAMGIHIPKGRDEVLTMRKILVSSTNRRFLIIADGMGYSDSEFIFFLQKIKEQATSMKVVGIPRSMAVSPEIGSTERIVDEWASLSDDEAWTLLCHEIADVSDDPDVRIYLTNGGDSAMQCLFYLLLFSNAIESSQAIWSHWKSEGFIHHNVPIEREEAVAAHLVTTLQYRDLPHLRRLDLADTKSLTTVPWHQIDRLPKALNWDQCSHQCPREEQLETKHGYCICVSDDKIFQTLSTDSMLWKNDLKKFRISVISCDHRQQQHPKDEDNPFERIHFIYSDIYVAQTKHFTKFVRSYNRSLEIGSTNDVPLGIRGVLCQTQFLSLFDNESITRLSQLGVENLDSLIECRIDKCQTMQSLLAIGGSGRIQAFSRLENLLVFNLTNLKSLCNGRFGEGSFSCLKYICLEHCRKLFSLFSLRVRFEKLEILEIRFCDKLERVFEEDDVTGEDVFPRLKELCLWELRKLKSICSGDLPTLEKVRIHGCRLLHKLPLLSASNNKLMSIVITGERAWHQNLK